MDDDPKRLFPLFVTSEAVTPELIDEFLATSKDELPWREDRDSEYIFCLLRTSTDAASELNRLHKRGKIMGARPHTTAHERLDFKKAKVMTLAHYVISHFAKADKRPSTHGPIEDAHFIVLDERSAQDKTCLMVQIPYKEEIGEDGASVFRHKLKTRKYYTDDRNWYDEMEPLDVDDAELEELEELRAEGPDELMAARCTFDLAFEVENVASRYGPQTMREINAVSESAGVAQKGAHTHD